MRNNDAPKFEVPYRRSNLGISPQASLEGGGLKVVPRQEKETGFPILEGQR